MTYTTTEAAKVIGCHRATVYRQAVANGIGKEYTTGRVFTNADITRLMDLIRPGKPGNPLMGPNQPKHYH